MPTGNVTVLEDCRVFVGGIDLSGQANQVGMGAAVTFNDVTSFGSANWAENRPGTRTSRLDVTTYLDESLTTTALDVGTTGLICTVCDDDAEFSDGYSLSGVSMSLGREMPIGEVLRQPVGLVGSGKMWHGELLLPRATRAAGGTGSIRQLGAVLSTQRVYASLHIFSATGGTVTATVQSAALVGFGSPTSRVSFSAASSGAQTLSTAGAITDQFWRISWTQTASSASFAVFVGIE